jgi:peptidyl-prolyl cis-trans isomerase B (cyclophilin B)
VFILTVIAAVLAFALAGCSAEPSDAQSDTPPAASQSTPAGDDEPAAVDQEDPMLHVSTTEVTGSERATMVTSKGTVVLEFFPEDAPNHVASFIELIDAGFYDGIKFHRVIPGFVAQGGDPITRDLTPEQVIAGGGGIGTGGPGWNQKAEFNARKHETGTLSMARSQHPDSAGSQFYICLAPQPSLDGQYTVFGEVVEGMDVVQALTVGDTIESITITR